MNSLPPIRPPSSCGIYSTPGYTGIPEGTDHHHDSLYYSKDTADCAMRAAAARIIGTPPPSVCVDCSALAGYAISTYLDADAVVTLQIVNYTDPGAGPYAAPSVMSVETTGTDVVVTWGPDNDDASISLAMIAAAIANDEAASAVLRIAVCDLDQFVAFNQGNPATLVIYPDHSHTSEDITDATEGGNGTDDATLLARYRSNGGLGSTETMTVISPDGSRTLTLHIQNGSAAVIHETAAGEDVIVFPAVPSGKLWSPGAPGTFAVIEGTTTDDDASTGNVGEYLEVEDEPAVVLSGVPIAAGSLSLSAGDWDVEGMALMSNIDGVIPCRFLAHLNDDEAVIGVNPTVVAVPLELGGVPVSVICFKTRVKRATVAPIYLNVMGTEIGAGSTLDYYKITARRVR